MSPRRWSDHDAAAVVRPRQPVLDHVEGAGDVHGERASAPDPAQRPGERPVQQLSLL
jgi:hypothetical protein